MKMTEQEIVLAQIVPGVVVTNRASGESFTKQDDDTWVSGSGEVKLNHEMAQMWEDLE